MQSAAFRQLFNHSAAARLSCPGILGVRSAALRHGLSAVLPFASPTKKSINVLLKQVFYQMLPNRVEYKIRDGIPSKKFKTD